MIATQSLLGNIGALAGKPVMEGKANLFKQFADLDVFDLEVGSEDPADVVKFCQLLEPTVGGINLEDIRAPECFEIERRLIDSLDIPVFHDDQHGTAIISGAALVNACEIAGKRIEDVKIVFAGAGAAAFGCVWLYLLLGAHTALHLDVLGPPGPASVAQAPGRRVRGGGSVQGADGGQAGHLRDNDRGTSPGRAWTVCRRRLTSATR